MNPVPCGNATVYCPVGSLAPVAVLGGYYSAPAVGVVTNATNIMAQQLDCPAGCVGGALRGLRAPSAPLPPHPPLLAAMLC